MNRQHAERARLMNDYSIIGNGIPMMSADQHPVELDDVLYSGSAGSEGYGDDKKATFEVTAWRVIQLNYKDRYARLRNINGKEMTAGFEDISHQTLFHDFKLVQKSLLEGLLNEMSLVTKEIEVRTCLRNGLESTYKFVQKLKVPASPVPSKKVTAKDDKPRRTNH